MKQVQAHITQRQNEFKQHPFFHALRRNTSIEPFKQFIPQVAFWVFAFQDALRINESMMQSDYYYKIARHHRMEDEGHDQWYVHDLNYFFGPNHFKMPWLFSQKQQTARDISYRLIAQTLHLDEDVLRIALLFSFESSGHVFFQEVAEHTQAMGYEGKLQYFDRSHLAIEQAHELFEQEMEKDLNEKALNPELRNRAFQLVDQCFSAFSEILMQYFKAETNPTNQLEEGEYAGKSVES